jgi:hypothetical protein
LSKHRPQPIPARLRRYARERGAWWVARRSATWAAGYGIGLALSVRPPRRTFELDGREYTYLHHRYHYTWLNERAVEVALARRVLAGHDPQDVLEVGNVLPHYLDTRHAVVDKYERAAGVHNADVVDLSPGREYGLIVSVSTLEHVGLDEDVRDPGKPVRAIRRLVELLAPGGTLWLTVPVGYNRELDDRLRDGAVAFDRLAALRRDPHRNRWRQVPVEQVWDAAYDRLLYTAHGLLIGEVGGVGRVGGARRLP